MNRRMAWVLVFAAVILLGTGSEASAQQVNAAQIAGGRGGSSFADSLPAQGARIAEVRVRAGDTVDSVQVIYVLPDGRLTEGARHGGRGGRENIFRIDSDEYITGISGRYGDTVDSMRIHTNKRTSSTFGGHGGDNDFHIDVPSGSQAVGFVGRSGDTVDAIGLSSAPLPRSTMRGSGTALAGGRGGSPFEDSLPAQGARIAEVRVRAGDTVDSVQVIYTLPNGRLSEGPRHGGRGGHENVIRLDTDEYIIGISGRYGDTIDSMCIHTNKRTSPLYGGRGGDRDFRVDVPSGNQATGFSGRAGDTLDAVGLVYGRATGRNPRDRFRPSPGTRD